MYRTIVIPPQSEIYPDSIIQQSDEKYKSNFEKAELIKVRYFLLLKVEYVSPVG
ncbi:MAG: hypothetical protein HPY60_09540 [Candidatus Methanofastidiosum sp.]|nr:hypothetical protein [Methanofastidiosum sp.]